MANNRDNIFIRPKIIFFVKLLYFRLLFQIDICSNRMYQINTTNLVPSLIHSGQDNKAIALLYKYSFPKIKSYIAGNSGNLQDAEDVFQDTIIIFYKYVKSKKFDESNDVDAIVYTIARNLWINRVKRSRKVAFQEEIVEVKDFEPAMAERDIIDAERKEFIYNTFGQLGAKCKDILVQVIYYQASMKDLVKILGYSTEDSAKTQHYKCKQKLMELVGKNKGFKISLEHEI